VSVSVATFMSSPLVLSSFCKSFLPFPRFPGFVGVECSSPSRALDTSLSGVPALTGVCELSEAGTAGKILSLSDLLILILALEELRLGGRERCSAVKPGGITGVGFLDSVVVSPSPEGPPTTGELKPL